MCSCGENRFGSDAFSHLEDRTRAYGNDGYCPGLVYPDRLDPAREVPSEILLSTVTVRFGGVAVSL